MAEREFPSNHEGATPPNAVQPPGQQPEREKKVEKIQGLGEVVVKKPTLGQRFKKTFIGGDAKGAWAYVWTGVLVPTAKNMLLDAIQQGSERLVIGEVRTRPSTGTTMVGGILGLGHQAYNKMYTGPMPAQQGMLTPQARATHDFSQFVVATRAGAELVIDRLFDLLQRDGRVTVADFMDMIGEPADYTMQKWGWVDLRGSQALRVPQGYLLDLPRPVPLD